MNVFLLLLGINLSILFFMFLTGSKRNIESRTEKEEEILKKGKL